VTIVHVTIIHSVAHHGLHHLARKYAINLPMCAWRGKETAVLVSGTLDGLSCLRCTVVLMGIRVREVFPSVRVAI
jgi:hypothetical protein